MNNPAQSTESIVLMVITKCIGESDVELWAGFN